MEYHIQAGDSAVFVTRGMNHLIARNTEDGRVILMARNPDDDARDMRLVTKTDTGSSLYVHPEKVTSPTQSEELLALSNEIIDDAMKALSRVKKRHGSGGT